jgi:hypothetical protein
VRTIRQRIDSLRSSATAWRDQAKRPSRAVDRKERRRALRTMADMAEWEAETLEALVAALEPLLVAGQGLSNAASNVSQAAWGALDDRARASLRSGYHDWDAARIALRKATGL